MACKSKFAANCDTLYYHRLLTAQMTLSFRILRQIDLTLLKHTAARTLPKFEQLLDPVQCRAPPERLRVGGCLSAISNWKGLLGRLADSHVFQPKHSEITLSGRIFRLSATSSFAPPRTLDYAI